MKSQKKNIIQLYEMYNVAEVVETLQAGDRIISNSAEITVTSSIESV